MTSGNLRAARRLYEAFESQDARALVAGLAPGFRGIVSDGMPEGLGGSYDGPEAMLRGCWARVYALVDVRPVPDEYLSAGAPNAWSYSVATLASPEQPTARCPPHLRTSSALGTAS